MSKFALCIGISKYGNGNLGMGNNILPGTVHSSQQIARLLKSHGFTVTELYDDQATYANILNHMVNMIRSGTVNFLQWCGHGARLNVPGQGSTDALIPIDVLPSDGSVHLDKAITAELYHTELGRRNFRSHTYINLDVCYSAAFKATQGMIGHSLDFGSHKLQITDFDPQMTELTGAPATNMTGLVCLSACGANQLSVEMPIGGSVWECIWSYALRNAGDGTVSQVFAKAKAAAMKMYASATPELHGDAKLLSGAFLS